MRNKLCKSMMLISIIFIPILFSCASTQQKQSESRDAEFYYNRAEVAQAMEAGSNLYIAYLKGPTTDVRIEKERAKIDDFCDFIYNAYIVDSNIYFIAEPPSANRIVVGRHYKVSTDGVITKSTKSCFSLQPVSTYTVFFSVTHLLSDTPSEFHVFLSLKYKIPIYVLTQKCTWKVDQGKITFVEKRK